MEPFEDWPWLVWLVGSAVLACTEMLTGDFTLLMLAGGAAAGALTAFFLPGMILVQAIVAVAVAILMLAVLRPTLLRRVRELLDTVRPWTSWLAPTASRPVRSPMGTDKSRLTARSGRLGRSSPA